ncbi:hypothetical protein [Gabonibacter massiliensis]|uniref:hypothetical protein n=1 Tax=Gabonibacter massiliensis TaxID=1720195 RepID=UPI000A4D094C|nr:hypothetical protein [Gabonibacter massiliensis]
MKKSFTQYMIVFLMSFIVAGCQDEFLKEETIGEGHAMVSATLDFKPMSSALARARTAGDALKDISSLHVLLYDYETKALKKSWEIKGYTMSDEDRKNTDAENGHSAEEKTRRATFKLPEEIEFGKYYIYAVANIPDLLTNSKYSEAIKTVEDLKNIPLAWDSENIANNGQMIGFFTKKSAPALSADDESLVVNEKSVKLHAWVRRAASKVTIAYDGSNLKKDVSIYIMAASIKDIPRSCPLGMPNTPAHNDLLVHDGGIIKYFEGDIQPDVDGFKDHYKAVITNQTPTYGSDHSETADALFFYENMQGEGKDKTQTAPGPGNNNGNDHAIGYPNPDKDVEGSGWKDNKPYGTYIEVKAIYQSTNTERPGNGIITYRFMLGKDIYRDYNAERNHHYKLTLKFNNFANDYDWHIEYKEQVLEVTEPKVMNYQGKVFVPDNSLPNRGHKFSDKNTVTVTSYIEENEKIKMDFSIKYRDSGKADFSDASEWLECVIEDGDVPYEKKVGFKVKEERLQPDEKININAKLQSAPSKGSKDAPYNLADPNGTPNSIVCTANCYMVDAPGWYIFPLVYGNAIHNGIDNKSSYTYTGGSTGDNILSVFRNHLNKPITSPYIKKNEGCNPTNAYFVWQDVNDLLRPSYTWESEPHDESPTYLPDAYDGKGGIRFYVGANIKQGNAIIAISDKAPEKVNDGTWRVIYPNAIWSWHIWVTRLDVEDSDKTIKVTAHDTNRKFEFMPMNLGWCSEDGEEIKYYKERECEVQFISGNKIQTIKIVKKSHMAFTRGNNPYYQWGRKDPFGGRTEDRVNKKRWNYIGYDVNDNPPLLTGYFDDSKLTTRAALHLLIQKPDTWHNPPRTTGTGGHDFDSDNKTYANLWEGRPGTDPSAQILKTIYDPCPVGYQVSHYNAFTGFTTTGNNTDYSPEWYDVRVENIADYDETTQSCGIYSDNLYEFYTNPDKYQSIIFPQTGYRDWNSYADVYHLDKIGYVWAAGNVKNDDNNSYNFEFSRMDEGSNSYVRPKNTFYPCDGFPVRPVRNGNHGVNTP